MHILTIKRICEKWLSLYCSYHPHHHTFFTITYAHTKHHAQRSHISHNIIYFISHNNKNKKISSFSLVVCNAIQREEAKKQKKKMRKISSSVKYLRRNKNLYRLSVSVTMCLWRSLMKKEEEKTQEKFSIFIFFPSSLSFFTRSHTAIILPYIWALASLSSLVPVVLIRYFKSESTKNHLFFVYFLSRCVDSYFVLISFLSHCVRRQRKKITIWFRYFFYWRS